MSLPHVTMPCRWTSHDAGSCCAKIAAVDNGVETLMGELEHPGVCGRRGRVDPGMDQAVTRARASETLCAAPLRSTAWRPASRELTVPPWMRRCRRSATAAGMPRFSMAIGTRSGDHAMDSGHLPGHADAAELGWRAVRQPVPWARRDAPEAQRSPGSAVAIGGRRCRRGDAGRRARG